MVSWRDLERLMAAGEYQRCLQVGRLLLEEGDPAGEEAGRTWALLCRCYLLAGDPLRALDAGRRAEAIASGQAMADLTAAVLGDLATALATLRRYEEALAVLNRFYRLLPDCTAAQCLEGAALCRHGAVMGQLGRLHEAAARYHEAIRWYRRFGDEAAAGESLQELTQLWLDHQRADQAYSLLLEGDSHLAQYPHERAFHARHRLLRARYHRMAGRWQESTDEAYAALDLSDELSAVRAESQLLLSRNAAEVDQRVEALGFALSARVTAVDGRLYSLEYQACTWLADLVCRYGSAALAELERALEQVGVDLYQYLPAPLVP